MTPIFAGPAAQRRKALAEDAGLVPPADAPAAAPEPPVNPPVAHDLPPIVPPDAAAAPALPEPPVNNPARADAVYTAEALADEITEVLPGLKKMPAFRQFSGYLPITETKNIFYWYVEAAEDAATAPLVFWTNGGPGCSGLFGFLAENGPFRPLKDGATLAVNPYSWNRKANMLFVEQPVSVGFSFATNEMDKQFGDAQAAEDNYRVIQTFLGRYPHLRPHDFYLSGESYGGHYLPSLARYIVDKNNEGPSSEAGGVVNLKGFLVGNPSTDPVLQLIGQVETLKARQALPPALYERWVTLCASTPTAAHLGAPQCLMVQRQILEAIKTLDVYSIATPPCQLESDAGAAAAEDVVAGTSKDKGRGNKGMLGNQQQFWTGPRFEAVAKGLRQHEDDSPPGPRFLRPASVAGVSNTSAALPYDSCQALYGAAYLNRPDVKAAIHAQGSVAWEDCSSLVLDNYQRADWGVVLEPTFRFLAEEAQDLRILLYSGDDDTVCSTLGTSMWLETLGWTTKDDWRPWRVAEGMAPAGQLKRYENGVVFATVVGAGHAVPSFKPREALFLFSEYLDNRL